MKKKGIALFAMLVLSAVFAVSGCGGTGGNPDNTQTPSGSGDVYQDYDPSKQPGGDSFGYDGNYSSPELTIDGKGDDPQWQAIKAPLFTYGKNDAVSVKAYRGTSALFFLFDVKDTVLLTQGVTNDDAVTRGDSIEFYIDTKADGGRSPQSDDFQINLGIHGKTRIMQGAGGQWGIWNGLIDYEVDLHGTLNDGDAANDTGYTVEVMVQYKDILIGKDDTIGFAVGQVDKIRTEDAPNGNNDGNHGPWDWFGWSRVRDPQVPDTYVLLQADGTIISRDQQQKPPADIAGTVRDAEGNPIEGATVKVTVGTEEKTAATDAIGYFCFEDVDSNATYTVTIEKEGYLEGTQTYTRDELRASNGGKVVKDIELIATATLKYTTLTGTVKNVVNGAVGGAAVTVKGTSITTTASADGTFTLPEVPANSGAITLTVSKSGYAESETAIAEETLQADGTTALGDVNLSLPWADLGTFAAKSQFFVAASTTLTRTLTGIQMHFDGARRLSGRIEVYVDTKTTTDPRTQDSTAWCFRLKDDGTIDGDRYTTTFSAQGLVWTISHNDSDGFIGDFYIPYSYLEITSLEVFGVEFGQWSPTAPPPKPGEGVGDWDGWTNCPVGQAPSAENPTTWLRVGARNNLYRATDNSTKAAFSGTVTSDGKGIAGVTVEANGASTTTDASGKWNMDVSVISEAVTVTYTKQGYVTATTEIAAGYLDTHVSWSDEKQLTERKITISGKVTDQDGAALNDVEVELLELGMSAKTDESGEYTIENVTTFKALTVKFSRDGYADGAESLTLDQLNEATVTVNKSLTSTTQVQQLTLTGKIVGVEGGIEGATIKLKGGYGNLATTTTDGAFSIDNFSVVDCTLVISKEGYLDREYTFNASAAAEATGSFAIVEEIFLTREYAKLNGLIADLNENFSAFKGSFTRSEVGFEFRFEGKRAFTGRIELFVDTKTSAGDGARDLTDYLFNLNADGTVTIVNWGDGEKNEVVPSDMKLKITNIDTTPIVEFTLPYAFFGQKNAGMGITSTEVIGISAGQFSQSANAWDGWDDFAHFGANNSAFVKPEMPQDYIRLGVHNEVYSKADNEALDLSSYEIEFATGENTDTEAGTRPVVEADYFYAKVLSRDSTGVTFSFLTTGDFGMEGSEHEMVLIYFDTGITGEKHPNINDWPEVDYLIKIASDGTVYGSNGEGKPKGAAWWSATDDDKTGETVTITRANGVCTFEYKITYERLGIEQNDVFGIALREASHNAGDHHLYDPWYDCYFGGNHIDAAATAQYIRVKADGTLTTANSNAEVD